MSSIISEILVLDSRQKNSGTNQAANYSLINMGGIGVGTYEMLGYHSVNQMYNVETGVNNTIYFDQGGGLLTGVMVAGNYTTATMLTEIVRAMDAVGGGVTYGTSAHDAASNKYTITPSAATMGFLFLANTAASARRLLGKDAVDDVLGANQVSDNVLDQRLHSNIFITVAQEGNKHVTVNNGSEFSLIVPLDSAFGDAIHHRKQEHYQQTIVFSTNISIIDVQLFTQDGVALVNAPDYELLLRKLF